MYIILKYMLYGRKKHASETYQISNINRNVYEKTVMGKFILMLSVYMYMRILYTFISLIWSILCVLHLFLNK